jgi:hypothetical protein
MWQAMTITAIRCSLNYSTCPFFLEVSRIDGLSMPGTAELSEKCTYIHIIYIPLIPVWLQTHQMKLETRFSDTLHLLIPKRVMQTKGPSEQPAGFRQAFPSLVNIHQISK